MAKFVSFVVSEVRLVAAQTFPSRAEVPAIEVQGHESGLHCNIHCPPLLCPIYADGTLGGKFRRKNTKQTSWPEAKAVAAAWEAAGRWDDDEATAPPPKSPASDSASAPANITIERAVAAFLAEHAESSAPNTQKNYRIMMKEFKAHSAEKGYVMIDQWRPIDVREFRQSWQVSPVTSAKNMTFVKSFFEFTLSNEWIARNPARLVKNPR